MFPCGEAPAGLAMSRRVAAIRRQALGWVVSSSNEQGGERNPFFRRQRATSSSNAAFRMAPWSHEGATASPPMWEGDQAELQVPGEG